MLGTFTCARYRFVLQAETPLRLSAFAGATLRGGFGHVFKRTVCIWPPGDCRRCLLKQTCSYPYVFETAPPPGSAKLSGLDQLPRPFVIEPPEADHQQVYRPGDRFAFRLVLIGRGIDYLPYFLFTFRELGRTGLGVDRGRYTLAEVHAEGVHGTRLLYRADEGVLHDDDERVGADQLAGAVAALRGPRLAIDFLTPTRIQSDGVVRQSLSFQDLLRALLRRLSSLCYFHCGSELDVDFRCLIDRATVVRTGESQLGRRHLERFSGRQGRRIEMSGVVGRVQF